MASQTTDIHLSSAQESHNPDKAQTTYPEKDSTYASPLVSCTAVSGESDRAPGSFTEAASPLEPSKWRAQTHRWWQHQNTFHLWWWETLCFGLTFVAFVGIISTLCKYEHRPLPQWPFGVSISTLIAIYTAVIKASAGCVLAEGISHLKWTMLFRERPYPLRGFVAHDNASRGPWGAIQLLWRDRLQGVSSLGAIIIILLFILDPFAQQVVRYYDCQRVSSDKTATITRTNIYPGSKLEKIANLRYEMNEFYPAISNAIFAQNMVKPRYSCPTGNCSFPDPYSSVGYCNACEDVTHKLVFMEYNEDSSDKNGQSTFTNVTFEQDEGSSLTLQRGGIQPYETLVSSITVTTLTNETTKLPLLGMVLHEEFKMIRWDGDGIHHDGNNTVRAFSCSFYPCVKTYTASVSAGRLSETLESQTDYISSSFVIPGSVDLWGVVDLDCLDEPPKQKQMLRDLGYEFDNSTRWLPYNISLDQTSETPRFSPGTLAKCSNTTKDGPEEFCNNNDKFLEIIRKAVPYRCIYNFWQSLGNSGLSNLLGGSVTQITDSLMGTPPLLALWKATSGTSALEDVKSFMDNITHSITTEIRQPRSNEPQWPSEPATGYIYTDTTCVKIKWAWVIYPAAIVAMFLLFFVWMILQSRAQQAELAPSHDFKSSALTFLFHGFDYESLSQLQEAGSDDDTQTLGRKIRDVQVRLVRTHQGWKLSSIKDSTGDN